MRQVIGTFKLRMKSICIKAAVSLGLAVLLQSVLPQAAAAQNAAPQLLQKLTGTPPAPAFALPDLDDAITKLSDLKGKILIVNFWATWCPPCRKEMPSMQRAWEKIKDKGVVLIGIHVGGNTDKIWDFTSQHNLTFPILIDKRGAVSKKWKTIGLPTTYVVDGRGRKIYRAIGGREWDDDQLLAQVLALRTGK